MVYESPTSFIIGFKNWDHATIERTTQDASNLDFPLLLYFGNAKVFGTALADFISHLTPPQVDGKNLSARLTARFIPLSAGEKMALH
jgi:hypothetical protein